MEHGSDLSERLIPCLLAVWLASSAMTPGLCAQDKIPAVAETAPPPAILTNQARPSPGDRPDGDRFIRVFISRNDRNGNGVVEKSEFRGAPARFDEMDVNGNRQLEPAELQPLFRSRLNDPKSMRERIRRPSGAEPPTTALATTPDGRPIDGKTIFQRLDRDGDKKLSVTEFSKSPGLANLEEAGEIVRSMDQDDDQCLSWPEFYHVFQMRHGTRPISTGTYNHPSLVALDAKGAAGASAEQLEGYQRIFNRLDANQDGNLTTKEFVQDGTYLTPEARARIFRVSDANRDGVVSRHEYVENRIITDEAKSIVERADFNGDKTVTRAEFLKHPALTNETTAATIYDQLDTDRDGSIRPPEYLRVWGRWARLDNRPLNGPPGPAQNQQGNRPVGPPGLGGPPPGRVPAGGPPNPALLWQRFDRNKDHQLARDEVPEFLWSRLASSDANKDGFITRKEWETRLPSQGVSP